MKLVDTHAHLDGEEFKDDLILVVERAVEKAVHHVLLPSINLASVDRVLELSREYKGYFYPTSSLQSARWGSTSTGAVSLSTNR